MLGSDAAKLQIINIIILYLLFVLVRDSMEHNYLMTDLAFKDNFQRSR